MIKINLNQIDSKDALNFWDNVGVKTSKDCWIWQAGILHDGYGSYSAGGKFFRAHRYSWQLQHGEIKDMLHVLHKCDDRRCVNPVHLWLGTNTDNIQDKMKKGRHISGEEWSKKNPVKAIVFSALRGGKHKEDKVFSTKELKQVKKGQKELECSLRKDVKQLKELVKRIERTTHAVLRSNKAVEVIERKIKLRVEIPNKKHRLRKKYPNQQQPTTRQMELPTKTIEVTKSSSHARVCKLTGEQVQAIRNKYSDGYSTQQQLAAEYGINQTGIGKILRRETWKKI